MATVGILDRDQRETLTTWLVGSSVLGPIAAVALRLVGVPVEFAILTCLPGALLAVWVFAALTSIPSWPAFFYGWLPASAVLAAIAYGGLGWLAGPATLLLLRLYAEAGIWIARKLGYYMPER